MTAGTTPEQPITPGHLAMMASSFARSAFRAYVEKEWHEVPPNGATSLELLAKAFLAQLNIDRILDKRARRARGSSTSERAKPMTIPARKALSLAAEDVPSLRSHLEDGYELLEIRNNTIHSARLDNTQARALLQPLVKITRELLTAASMSEEDYWGHCHDLARTLVREDLDESERYVHAHLEECKERHRRRYGSPVVQAAMRQIAEEGYRWDDSSEQHLIPCPACLMRAQATGWGEAIPPDQHSDGIYFFLPWRLQCNFCDLLLDSREQLIITGDVAWIVENGMNDYSAGAGPGGKPLRRPDEVEFELITAFLREPVTEILGPLEMEFQIEDQFDGSVDRLVVPCPSCTQLAYATGIRMSGYGHKPLFVTRYVTCGACQKHYEEEELSEMGIFGWVVENNPLTGDPSGREPTLEEDLQLMELRQTGALDQLDEWMEHRESWRKFLDEELGNNAA